MHIRLAILPILLIASLCPAATDPAELQQRILTEAAAGRPVIQIPPGVYRLAAPAGRFHLRLENLHDLVIDATGVTFLRTDPTRAGIEFLRCRNVTLRGLTLLNETPPFTQGQITAIDPAGLWWDIRFDAGYPANFDDPAHFKQPTIGYVFDPATRQWKPGTNDFSAQRIQRLAPDAVRLHFARPMKVETQPVLVGDLVAFRGHGDTDIHIGDCSAMRVENVKILSGGGFCIHESGGDGGNYYSYTVSYGPPPAGASTKPLIACNADAFHSSEVRKGPILENCLFEGMPDDGIPIHGSYAMLVASAADRIVLLFRGANIFRDGDPIRLFNAEGVFAGEAIVKSARPLPGYSSPAPILRDRFKDAKRFVEFTLDRPLPGAFGFLASNPGANGSGYVIRNNTIRNHRARGMLLKADDGLVEGNTVDGSTIAGIVLSPEYWWNEACYSRNVIVRNNTVRHTGYASVGPWTSQAGAISLAPADKLTASPGHRHIVIENNTIENCDGTNLLIAAAQDVLIRNNRFIHPQQAPTNRGADRGVDPAALIHITHCDDIRLEANIVTAPGPCNQSFLKTDNTTRLQASPDSIRRP